MPSLGPSGLVVGPHVGVWQFDGLDCCPIMCAPPGLASRSFGGASGAAWLGHVFGFGANGQPRRGAAGPFSR
eukprot:7801569-Pyramimonas_sp.AAC.1